MAAAPPDVASPADPFASANGEDSLMAGGGSADVARLLESIDESAAGVGHASQARVAAAARHEQLLAEGRLGMVSALFTSLRYKHPATASHSLRVALGCSTWAAALAMPDKLRTQLEAAALLHDVGKIGVPDAVLTKPGRLTSGEVEEIDRSREAARAILASAGAPNVVVEGVYAAAAWFDGTHRTIRLTGEQTPFVSRMIAIVDAFDSMTTDQVYRPARSRERAIAALFEGAGTQFDPDLVASYCEVFSRDQSRLEADVARRWVAGIGDPTVTAAWNPTAATLHAQPDKPASPLSAFELRLLDNMHDAVLFVDSHLRILRWNTGAERLTGVGATAACGKEFAPSLLDMSAAAGELLEDEQCPVKRAVESGVQVLDRYSVMGRNGRSVSIDLHAIPVVEGGTPLGAAVILHDASSETTLEERCQALHAEMTKDPMTQVANRAEFDRMLAAFIDAHQDTGLPCSLIMADIDHFKSINDTYGHQAGDEAIMTVASLLKSMCRSGDLVARYGGEEFAVLCADCSNAAATKRAELIRRQLSETPHTYLGGAHITASFGVTELQMGDTPETMLRRADRGLLQAKDQGRNQVVTLGDGMSTEESTKSSWFGLSGWTMSAFTSGALLETRLVTNVPVELAVQKLKGFIADRDAKILRTEENHLRMETTDAVGGKSRRENDRPLGFIIDLRLSQHKIEKSNASGMAKGSYAHTFIDVTIKPKRDRDRRRGQAMDRARLLLGSLKSYLMAKEADVESVDPAPQA
ncbi:MAG: diguanylate cyclase domain-containing protein [Lacipirellulaceae bacterium]